MKTTTKRRAYGTLRDIIERRGGIMIYQRQGYRWGAWEISLEGKRAVIEAEGRRTFPKLDRLFVPKIADPKTWDDYDDKLVPGAEEQLFALLV